eukprot:7118-Heterococcus_DN1.PRE.3
MKPFHVAIIQNDQLDGHDIPELIEEMNKLEYTEDVWDNLQGIYKRAMSPADGTTLLADACGP